MSRKSIAVVLLIFLLSGCGKSQQTMQKALNFRTKLMQSEGCAFTADILADYGHKVYEFSVYVEADSDVTNLTVVEPEELSGISAQISEHGTKIVFDDIALDFGELANGYVSPVLAPWLLGQCWRSEYISSVGRDGEMERVTYLKGYDDQELTVNTWLDTGGIPVRAEVIFGSKRCLNIAIRDFQF